MAKNAANSHPDYFNDIEPLCVCAHPPTPPGSALTHSGVGRNAREDTFTITLRSLASDVPTAIRLRKLLKVALRQMSLRCVSVQQNCAAAPSEGTPPTITASETPTPQIACNCEGPAVAKKVTGPSPRGRADSGALTALTVTHSAPNLRRLLGR